MALVVGQPDVQLRGSAALVLRDGSGGRLLEVPGGVGVRAVAREGAVAIQIEGLSVGPTDVVAVEPVDPTSLVQVGSREYRGGLEIRAAGSGLTVVNRIGIESYLAGVVSAEMGRRAPADLAALAAQAVVSRTYALRALGKYRAQGFDLLATVADQAYGGVAAELAQGWEAVTATRGRILTYGGEPIEAFFHSTCAGRTAAGEEVYANGGHPYLHSVSDQAPDGTSWCAISPRYRWTEEWSATSLLDTFRRTLPPLGAAPDGLAPVEDVTVTGHTASGRVSAIAIRFRGGTVPVTGSNSVRQALRAPSGELLRSAAFRLVSTRRGRELVRLVAEGRGAGHGVGFCQWGAVGRARAGATVEAILSAYFPGTALERRW